MDGNLWRTTNYGNNIVYPSCNVMDLGSGILIGGDLPAPVMFADGIYFKSHCINNSPAFMAGTLRKIPGTYLEQSISDWDLHISRFDSDGGSFKYGVYPMIMSFITNFIITVTLTILTFLNMNDRPYVYTSRSLRLGSLLGSINMGISLSKLLSLIRNEYENRGVVEKHCVVSFFDSDTAFITLDFLSTFTLQCCQTFIVMRTFERNQEKRIVFFVGISLAILSNVLWVVPKYHHILYDKASTTEDSGWELLPPFVYMFKIIIASSYACFIVDYIVRTRKLCCQNLQLMFLTALTLIMVLLLPAFFIADVSNFWIFGLSDLFNTTCYVGCTFIVLEWLERISLVQKREQAQSILGRPIFEEEQQGYTFAKYALKVQDALTRKESVSTYTYSDNDEEDGRDVANLIPGSLAAETDSRNQISDNRSIDQIRFETKKNYIDIANERVGATMKNIVNFTDNIILKKLSARSFGGSSGNSSTSKNKEEIVKKRIGLDMSNKVYVYSTKDVQFESDDEFEVVPEFTTDNTDI